MSIAVLRVLRRVKANGGLDPTPEQQQAAVSQGVTKHCRDVATGGRTKEKEGTAAEPILRVW